MQLEQLEYFLTLARYEHVTNAAKACSISQPALSNAISRLENDLGVELFDRNGRNIQLNQFGTVFRQHVELGLREIEQGCREVREMSGLETGTVTMGVDCPEVVTRLVCGFYAQHPQVHIRQSHGNLSSLFRHLLSGQLDFIICEQNAAAGDADWTLLTQDRLYLLVLPDHPLVRQEAVYLKDLEGERIVCSRPGTGLRDTLDLLLSTHGIHTDIVFEGDDTGTIIQLVYMGAGITVLSGLALQLSEPGQPENLVQIPLANDFCVRELGIYTKRSHSLSRSAELFLDYIRGFFAGLTGGAEPQLPDDSRLTGDDHHGEG